MDQMMNTNLKSSFHMWGFMVCFVHIIFLKTKLKCISGSFEKGYDIADELRINLYVQLSLVYKF